MILRSIVCTLAGWFIAYPIYSQEIPLGTWRLHPSFNRITELAVAPDRIFAASDNAVMILHKAEGEISVLSKANGISGSRISDVAFDDSRDILLVAHENGVLDIIEGTTATTFDGIATSSSITGSRRINAIEISGPLAYLAAAFGVVVFDLNQKVIKETYRDLGEDGEPLKINEAVVFRDSLYLATEKGVIAGSLSGSNLLDYNNWTRYQEGDFASEARSITVFDDALYAGIEGSGVFKWTTVTWESQVFIPPVVSHIEGSQTHLLAFQGNEIWLYDGTSTSQQSPPQLNFINDGDADENGVIWIADETGGLFSVLNNLATVYKPNGPSVNDAGKVVFKDESTILVPGGYSPSGNPLNNPPLVDQFINGQWQAVATQLSGDITDFDRNGAALFISSFGYGLEQIENGNSVVFNDLNSPLQNSNPPQPFVLIPSIASSSDGLWVANYNVPNSLHLLKPNSEWESYAIPISQARFPLELEMDVAGQVWMRIDPARGGGIIIFNRASNQQKYLTSQAGSGGLPSDNVLSVASDREGQMWVGTDQGVAYFANPFAIFNSNIDASRPIFENAFLLRDEQITALAVDGGNRKWIGTPNGVWLFDARGERLIHNFTAENSLLPSNNILSIAINSTSGEVFFATDEGVASYRSDASASSTSFSNVRIFPNPVTAEFSGQIAIDGLYTDAIVKITDIAGRLVWQTQANGGTASWSGRQLNGNRVSTGMYLVFATAEDGSERHVGKIAIIE